MQILFIVDGKDKILGYQLYEGGEDLEDAIKCRWKFQRQIK